MKYIALFSIGLMLIGAGCLGDMQNEQTLEVNTDITVEDDSTNEQAEAVADGSYALDTEASTLAWDAQKIVGNHHTGTVGLESGSIEMEGGVVTSGTFVIDMQDITNDDVESDNMREQLLNHLASDDFFSTEAHPTATFTVTSATETELTGDLTIKDITHEITFPIEWAMEEDMLRGVATVDIDRTDWNVEFQSESLFAELGDAAIKDMITIGLDLVFTQDMAAEAEL